MEKASLDETMQFACFIVSIWYCWLFTQEKIYLLINLFFFLQKNIYIFMSFLDLVSFLGYLMYEWHPGEQ